jgi:hypothetical protein
VEDSQQKPINLAAMRIKGLRGRKGMIVMTLGTFLCLFQFAAAQEKLGESPDLVLKVNPLSFVVSTFNIQAEKPFNERFSGQLGFQFGSPKVSVYALNLLEPVKYQLIGLTPEMRYYVSFAKKHLPQGAYLGAYLRLQHVRKEYRILAYDPDTFQDRMVDVTVKINAFAGGFVLGYQFVVKRVFYVDVFMGPRYGAAASRLSVGCAGCDGDERNASRPGLDFDGMDLRAGIGIGYGFR